MYKDELDMMVRLAKALLLIQDVLEKNPVETPCAILAYNTVLYGLVPRIHTEDGVVTTSTPVGGISDALEVIDEAMEILQLEVDYEGRSDETEAC